MGLFDGMLKDGESLFKNELALDFSFQPKLIQHREKEQFFLASAIRPLFQGRSGRNILIHGKPGIGKTVAVKHVFRELEEEHDEVLPLYVNCWQHNTTYKIAVELCSLLGYTFIQNKKTQDLFKEIIKTLNKTSVVFAFDEVDRVEDFDFLYTLLEGVYRKSFILISNYREWLLGLDNRIKSRLSPELLAFKEYSLVELRDILSQRRDYAFISGIFSDDALEIAVARSFELKDVRSGLHLMKEAAMIAEDGSTCVVTREHASFAMQKLDELTIKDDSNLDEERQFILNLVKLNTGKKMKELFGLYQENGGRNSYRTFHRRINDLKDGKFVVVKKMEGGSEGMTSYVHFQNVKKLTDF
jgi:archaeal cell division control protein 6